jgi:hypothetical protein
MPIRFTSPGLGGHRQVFLQKGQAEFGVSYRYLTADDWFVGSEIVPELAPGGQPNIFHLHSVDFSLEYGVLDQLSLRLTVPVSTGTNSRWYAGDSTRHVTSATGVGDINLIANYWLLDRLTHPGGNIAVALGVKTPTGDHAHEADFPTPAGTIQFPVHPGLQLGDGGWGIIVQSQGYARLAGPLSGYFFGSYQLSPKEMTEVTFPGPTSTSPVSVPDVFHLRFGGAYPVWPSAGVSASLGVRFDGIPVTDILGGDGGFRTAGYTTYLDPGVSLTSGRSVFTVSVPFRMHGEFRQNVNDRNPPLPPGSVPGDRGDLASYLVFLGYAYRF